MGILVGVASVALILAVLWDAFETIVLPRRVNRRVRLTRVFYRSTWVPWSAVARRMRDGGRRETYLSFYGPLSLLLLLVVWAVSLIVGFAALQWALGSAMDSPGGTANFGTDLYVSGTTFLTLGLGDVTPNSVAARIVTVVETGTGFAFLALVVGYLPVLYQAFSRREINIALLDARAGSPPSAGELLRRYGTGGDTAVVGELLHDWERWSAELLESHLSYPLLAYYRSQHEHESWVAALTAILDTCALVLIGVEGVPVWPAQLTFAMARHAAVDLSQIFHTPPHASHSDRLSPPELARLRAMLAAAGVRLREGCEADEKLAELRRMYEPYVSALAYYLLMPLPPWIPAGVPDDWQTTAWEAPKVEAGGRGPGVRVTGPSP